MVSELKQDSAREALMTVLSVYQRDLQKLDIIDSWLRWDPAKIKTKATKDPEIKWLTQISQTPWPRLIVETTAQTLRLEGLFSAEQLDDTERRALWAPFQRNNMEVKQGQIHRAALGYGVAYTTVTPGEMHGERSAFIAAHSPREFTAIYADVVEDEFPMFALRVIPQPDKTVLYRLYDETSVYFFGKEAATDVPAFIESRAHDMGVCPVVRFAQQMDLEGRMPGEIEPVIPLFQRINKTDYDRMLTQHFNSWKVRTATGIDMENMSEEQREREKLKLRQQDILTGEGDVKFGTLDETNLKPFIEAHDSDIETLAAVTQTPFTTVGKLINVSAEGLVEARRSLQSKSLDKRSSFGTSYAQIGRLSAIIEGRTEIVTDYTLQSKWADTEAATMAAAVDALTKAAVGLGVPPELLWDRIPGVDTPTADAWKAYRADNPTAEDRQAAAVEKALAADKLTADA